MRPDSNMQPNFGDKILILNLNSNVQHLFEDKIRMEKYALNSSSK